MVVVLTERLTVDSDGAMSGTSSQADAASKAGRSSDQVKTRGTAGTAKYNERMDLGQGERGYAMAALLVALSVMAILMGAAMPVWSHMVRREKEAELIWRGEQYARAIALFQRKYANTFPPNVDVLVEQRFLRKKYKDPITGGDFQVIPAGAVAGVGATPGVVAGLPPTAGGAGGGAQSPAPPGPLPPSLPAGMAPMGIQGVVSKSTESSIRMYNGRTKYNEWFFIHLAGAQRVGDPAGPGGANRPGTPNLRPGGRPPAPGMLQPGGPPPGPFVPPGGIDLRPPVPGAPGSIANPPPFGLPVPTPPVLPPSQLQAQPPPKPPATPRAPR